jgi:hypothetical protein
MVLYRTTMVMSIGVALILLAHVMGRLARIVSPASGAAMTDPRPAPVTLEFDRRLWASTFTALGLVLAGLGGLSAATAQTTVNPPFNATIAQFGLTLGVLLLAAAGYLRCHGGPISDVTRTDLTPLAVPMICLGAIFVAGAAAILRFGVLGGAPPPEPITGLPHYAPALENTAFVLLYLGAGLGALLAPFTRLTAGPILRLVRSMWFVTGAACVCTATANFYLLTAQAWNAIHASTRYI